MLCERMPSALTWKKRKLASIINSEYPESKDQWEEYFYHMEVLKKFIPNIMANEGHILIQHLAVKIASLFHISMITIRSFPYFKVKEKLFLQILKIEQIHIFAKYPEAGIIDREMITLSISRHECIKLQVEEHYEFEGSRFNELAYFEEKDQQEIEISRAITHI